MKALICSLIAMSSLLSSAGDFRHIVMFQFKPTATPEQIKEIETEFAKLPKEIDTIKAFECGKMDNAEVGLNDGFTHAFLVTFKDKADLEKYLPHAAHQAFVTKLKPLLEKALVFDYEAKAE